MGSFYSTCSISDISIVGGDRMYMQLILPTWVKNPYSIDGEQIGCGEKGLRVSNEGALGEFVPFGFPIDGKYADYGNISDIKPSRNIEMLEEFFGISIKNIIDCATDDRWYKHSYKPSIEENKKEQYKGEYKCWTIGDNKMKNLDVLKQLTVTYFRKEHYDYLTEKWIGTDSYFGGEIKGRLKGMIDILPDLTEARPTDEPRKVFSLYEITDKLREKYTCVRSPKSTDDEFNEMIIRMENHRNGSWWEEKWDHKFYIPSISNYNMFKLLSIGEEDADDIRKQYTFIMNMYSLYKVLRPSYYGSQEDNFQAYVDFHKHSVELVGDIVLENKKDTILDEIGYVLRYGLKGVDQEVIDSVKKQITEGLEEYGYKLKL